MALWQTVVILLWRGSYDRDRLFCTFRETESVRQKKGARNGSFGFRCGKTVPGTFSVPAGFYSKRPSEEEHWRSQAHTIASFVARGTWRRYVTVFVHPVAPGLSVSPGTLLAVGKKRTRTD